MRSDDPPRADDIAEDSALSVLIAEQLPLWLPEQRWFGDKGRAIERVTLVAMLGGPDGGPFVLTVVRVQFVAGEPALYLLPLAVEPGLATGSASLADATTFPHFGHWLLERFLDPRKTDAGPWHFLLYGNAETLELAKKTLSSVMGAEQSNTSIRFGDALIVKLFRRLQAGPNPDEEILGALSKTTFVQSPALVGTASWRAPADVDMPIALIQQFVPNRGDGWTWMLERLGSLADSGVLAGDFAPEQRLGRRTGELHLALSGLSSPAFAPEPMLALAVAEQIARTEQASRDAAALLIERQQTLSATTRLVLSDVVAALENPAERVAGFKVEIARLRARVHGDFHLGQTLRTLDDDWEIIDFEGEPARSVSERRQKVSVLKDVAGMLRSFAYARGAATRTTHATVGRERLAWWERGARHAFMAEYRAVLRDGGSLLVPENDADFALATDAWEFDKAVYEIAYEARNRPDWLEIPLRSLFPDLFTQAPDVSGAAPA